MHLIPLLAGSARSNAKKREKKRTKGEEERRKNRSRQRAKPSTPTLAKDAIIGEGEQNEKQKIEHKKESESTIQLP